LGSNNLGIISQPITGRFNVFITGTIHTKCPTEQTTLVPLTDMNKSVPTADFRKKGEAIIRNVLGMPTIRGRAVQKIRRG